MPPTPDPSPRPFFLTAPQGQRFCIYFPPATKACRGNILHIHAFTEEMNKSRRMVALQARSLARLGLGVLLFDLYGCGDSSGNFSDARWDIWKDDITHALAWLRKHNERPVTLWGLRLGVLLMMDYARDARESFESFLMWQPVISGKAYLTQFLRLRLASEIMTGGRSTTGTQDLKKALYSGEFLEIAGYTLAPDLARALDVCELDDLCIRGGAYHWFEIVSGENQSISPASQRLVDGLRERGIQVDTFAVPGDPFWTTQEIAECSALIKATCRKFGTVP